MRKYDEIIENPLFFKWIYNPTQEIESYWQDFIKKNPHDGALVLEFKKKLKKIKIDIDSLTSSEKIKLAYQISKKLDREDRNRKIRKQFFGLMKYAAVAILFYFSGAVTYYLYNDDDEPIQYIESEIPNYPTGPRLILSEGNSIALNDGKSTLDYRNKGEIVLNEDSIIHTYEPSKINQLIIPHGSSSKVVLSDGSQVWLNAGSRLVYPSVFNKSSREVTLFGEAYFSIKKNNSKPFIVQTPEIEIQVLGTQFNVSAYSEDNIIQTVLKEGSVAIRKAGTKQSDRDIILKPNQLVSFDKNTQLARIKNVNTDFYTLWTEGLLSFENSDLNRVIKKIERYYDIVIQFENPLLGTMKISGKLDLKQDKEEIFEYISLVSSSTFEQIDKLHYRIK